MLGDLGVVVRRAAARTGRTCDGHGENEQKQLDIKATVRRQQNTVRTPRRGALAVARPVRRAALKNAVAFPRPVRAKHTQQGEVTIWALSWSLLGRALGENDDGGEGRKRTAPHVEVGGAPCASESARGGRTAKSPRPTLTCMSQILCSPAKGRASTVTVGKGRYLCSSTKRVVNHESANQKLRFDISGAAELSELMKND